VVAGFAAAALALGGVAVAAALSPASKTASDEVAWNEQLDVDYGASVPQSAVYPTGQVRTGEPVFRRLVDQLDIRAGWSLETQAPYQVRGTAQLVGTLHGPSGWNRTLDLTPTREFTGGQVAVAALLDLRELERMAARVSALTGLPGDTYTLDLRVAVDIEGTVAGQPISETGEGPKVTLSVTPTTVLPGTAEGAADPTAGEQLLSASTTHTVTTTRPEPARWGVFGQQISVTTARNVGVVGAGLAAAAVLLLLVQRPRNREDPRRIAAQYGRSIVAITTVAVADTRTMIDVTGIDALARIAQRYDRLILHQPDPVGTYLVEDEGTVYRYQPRTAQDRRPGASRSTTSSSDRALRG